MIGALTGISAGAWPSLRMPCTGLFPALL